MDTLITNAPDGGLIWAPCGPIKIRPTPEWDGKAEFEVNGVRKTLDPDEQYAWCFRLLIQLQVRPHDSDHVEVTSPVSIQDTLALSLDAIEDLMRYIELIAELAVTPKN